MPTMAGPVLAGSFESGVGAGTLLLTGSVSGTDISPVPLPAALPLFGSALVGLFGLARRQKFRVSQETP